MMQHVTIPTSPLPAYLMLSSREAAGHVRFLLSSQRIQKDLLELILKILKVFTVKVWPLAQSDMVFGFQSTTLKIKAAQGPNQHSGNEGRTSKQSAVNLGRQAESFHDIWDMRHVGMKKPQVQMQK